MLDIVQTDHIRSRPGSIADVDDVMAAYLVILGRNTESLSVAREQSGIAMFEMISGFVRSDEFKQIRATVMQGGPLPHASLSGKDFKKAARWIARILEAPVPAATTNWPLLLTMLLKSDACADIGVELQLMDFQDILAAMTDVDLAQTEGLTPFLQLNEEWFLRANPRAALVAAANGSPDVAIFYLDNCLDGKTQLLPAFSEGLAIVADQLLDEKDVLIQDVIRETLSGAQARVVSHWLFSPGYYQRGLDKQKAGANQSSSDSSISPYLSFLCSDAQDAIQAPHPLFCYYSYRNLNKPSDFLHGATFLDYISHGCFANLATSCVFDADFYLASNPKARYALLTKTHVSALHHFLTVGIFEDLAFSPDFDREYYLQCNLEVSTAIEGGHIPSVAWHFIHFGLGEGKAPNRYFNPKYYRERHPHAPEDMRRLGIGSELEHFLLIGKARGYKPERPLVASTPAIDASKAVFQRRARRSFNNIVRTPLDFSKYGDGTIQLSVVVPVFNEFEFTSRFLECAYFAAGYFRQTTGLSCEVVVVDNGSTDWTDRLLRSCRGVKIIAYGHPIGFPRAANAGVAESTGRIVVVANNDIEFAPDVFVKVWQRLLAEPSIGVLGGLTILPNETLQEAGSYLDNNANVIGLGRNENPWDQFFQGVNQVDYCTGSFISFRREDYDALGGLDEGFSPGYYEETDFMFRMRETLGKSAAVDSDIQVTHFEHASFGKGRPPTTAYALIKKNQAYFASKHREALRQKPSNAQLMSPEGARPSAVGRARLLVIEDLLPDSRLGSGFVRSAQLLASLTAHQIAYDLLVLSPNSVVDDFADPRVNVFRGWMPGEDPASLLSTKMPRYSHVMVCRTHNLGRFGHQLEALRSQHGIKVICDTEALSILRTLEIEALSGTAVSDAERTSAVRLELDAPVNVDQWIAVTPYEKDQIAAAGFGPTAVICHHFDMSPPDAGRSWGDRHRVVAVGAVHEAGSPNHDGLFWFMDQIYPQCRESLRGLTLTIVGFWHPDIRKAFRDRYVAANIDFVGVVSDRELAALYEESRIALAPTRFAAGVASKVLEPMMQGLPVVLTDLLARQLLGSGAAADSGLAVGARTDGGISFARWVTRLATDEVAWGEVRRRQYDAALPLGGIEAFERGVRTMLSSAGLQPSLSPKPAH